MFGDGKNYLQAIMEVTPLYISDKTVPLLLENLCIRQKRP